MPREPDWWMHVTPSLPLTEATVEVEGLPIYYRTGGSGPPLLLLHGFTVTGQMCNPFLGALGQHHTVIVPDLPGHGRSSRPDGHFVYRHTARQMFGLLDALGVDRVRVIGHSGGAMVLLQMALQQPERVAAMAILSGALRMLSSQRERQRSVSWEAFDAARRDRYLRMHPGGLPQIEWLLAECRRHGDSYDDFDAPSEQLATIQARTLLVWGDQDVVFPVELALEMYRAIPNCALWVIPGGGHGVVWGLEEATEQFPWVVLRFFSDEWPG